MKKVIAALIAASFLGLGSLSFAQDKSAASTKDKPTAVKTKPTTPADANPNVKPPAGAVQDGGDKTKPIVIVDPIRPRPIEKELFGLWLDKEGFVVPGPKIKNFIDQDRDGTDDRFQRKPGAPAGKPRPEKPGEKPGDGSAKPGKPGGKPGEKPGGQLGGGDDRPKPPAPFRPAPRPELPDDLQDQVDLFKATQDTLRDGLKAKIDALGDDATREDVKAAAEAFKADNKDAIEAQMAAGKALHEAIKENRPDRENIERPEPPAAVKEKADAMRAVRQTLGKARHDLHKALKDASDEDRKAMVAAFKEAQKEHHQDLKEAKKALREAIRDNAETGARRSED